MATGMMPGSAAQCVSRVELRVECNALMNRDVTSKSDPCALLYIHDGQKWLEQCRTEIIKNNLYPKFVKVLPVDYYFETVQKVKVALYDIDNNTKPVEENDFLGHIECTMGQLVSGSPFTRPLLKKNSDKAGESTITVRSEEVKEGSELVEMMFRARKLDKKDFMGKSDPFLQISSQTNDGNQQVIWKTEVVKNNLNPEWQKFSIRKSTLCGGDHSRSIHFDVYDWDGDGSHDMIGGFNTTLEEMLKAVDGGVSWPCINHKKKEKKKNYKDSGTVTLTKCQLIKEFSFLDFIFGGLQMNLTIAIDFTGSNGDPREASSLHYIDPMRPNEYMQAIRAVGNVVQDYDSDKQFPTLGFGAKLPNGQVSFEFAVNFNPANPFCAGIDGVLQAYQGCIRQVRLYGPTNVAPIIDHVARFAAQARDQEMQGTGAAAYYILLLLTDGVITDESETIDSVVRASALPMSIIIVGVGGADFTLMNKLDGDDDVLVSPSSGHRAVRDIVQFVPFRQFQHSSAEQLARHVLAEIPGQVTTYFKTRGLPPNTRVQQ